MVTITYAYAISGKKGNISKKLFGYRDTTAGGRYSYNRPGLLDMYPCKRIAPGVLLVDDKQKKAVMSVLRKHGLSATEEHIY